VRGRTLRLLLSGKNSRRGGIFDMARKYIDCRDYPQTEKKCTLAISADSEEEVLEAAVQHGRAAHGYEDTTEFRDRIRAEIKEGSPPM